MKNRINYLDGLRGWAALIVLLCHTSAAFTYDVPVQPQFLTTIRNGYFRILLDGGVSVKIFFVLSGIVLSMAFIKNSDFKKLAALIIKRIPRLGIPIFVMALISHLLMESGLMYNHRAVEVLGKNTWLSWCYDFNSSIFKVIKDTFLSTFWGNGNPYSTALWTMPHEMLGSIFVVIVLMIATYMNKKKIFIPLIILFASLSVLALKGERHAYSSTFICFLSGILISYYIVYKDKITFPIRTVFIKIIISALFILLYYNQLPYPDLKMNLIAVLVVVFVVLSPFSQKILSHKISVFLGKISFPLYVIHMTVICSLTSFLITKDYNPNDTKLVVSYFAITVIVSVISACILYPVEKIAITLSGKIFEYLSSDSKTNFEEIIGSIKKVISKITPGV